MKHIMRPTLLCLSILLTQCAPLLGATAYNRWAVISSPEVIKSGVADLVTVEAAKIPGIELVERDQIEAMTRELELDQLSGAAAVNSRLKLGNQLKADALAILSMHGSETNCCVKLIICDCLYGARLQMQTFPYTPNEKAVVAGRIAESVNAVRAKYASGIERIIGISPLVSKSFLHDYDHLQSAYSYLLQSVFAALPGVAVIETEEAHAIAMENLTPEQTLVKRIVPMLISGEFQFELAKPGKTPTGQITLWVRQSDSTLGTFHGQSILLPDMGNYLVTNVVKQIMEKVALRQAGGISVDRQFAWLTQSADDFALLGSWNEASGLREAAILLKPDDMGQRVRLVGECGRMLGEKYVVGLSHLEYLIRNRQVDFDTAVRLCTPFSWALGLTPEAQKAQEEFVLKTAPLITARASNAVDQRSLLCWSSQLAGVAMLPLRDLRGQKEQDLIFAKRVLTEVMPENCPSPGTLNAILTVLHDIAWDYQIHEQHESLDAICATNTNVRTWLSFLEDLSKARNKTTSTLGGYGLVSWRVAYELSDARFAIGADFGEIGELDRKAALQRLHSLLRELDAFAEEGLEDPYSLRDSLRENMRNLIALDVGSGETPKKQEYTEDNGRLVFSPLKLQMKTASGDLPPYKQRLWEAHGASRRGLVCGPLGILECSKNLDIVWTRMSVFYLRQDGILEETHAFPYERGGDVKWDGSNAWANLRVSRSYPESPCLTIIDAAGKTLHKIGEKEGLPPCRQGLLIQPLSPGKVFAAGSHGGRGWCAAISIETGKPEISVFHTATHVPQTEEDCMDSQTVFVPTWIHEYNHGRNDGSRVFLVGRGAMGFPNVESYPLFVELTTSNVWVLARKINSSSIYSRDGEMFVCGAALLEHHTSLGNLWVDGSRSKECCRLRDRDGRVMNPSDTMVYYQDSLYLPSGSSWMRFNLRTQKEEILVDHKLPEPYCSFDAFGASGRYGLLAWRMYFAEWNEKSAESLGGFYVVNIKDGDETEQHAAKHVSQASRSTQKPAIRPGDAGSFLYEANIRKWLTAEGFKNYRLEMDEKGVCILELWKADNSQLAKLKLQGLPLKSLTLHDSKNVTDILSLVGNPLVRLDIRDTLVTDVSPLAGLPLERLDLDIAKVTKGLAEPCNMTTLRVLNGDSCVDRFPKILSDQEDKGPENICTRNGGR